MVPAVPLAMHYAGRYSSGFGVRGRPSYFYVDKLNSQIIGHMLGMARGYRISEGSVLVLYMYIHTYMNTYDDTYESSDEVDRYPYGYKDATLKMRPAVRASNRVPCHRYATLIKGTCKADADGFSGISTHICTCT